MDRDQHPDPKGGRSILFVRHGETDYNRRHVRCGGDVDIPLTANGEAQVRRTAERLRSWPDRIDAIVTSPLQRTRRTAAIIQDTLEDGPPLDLHDGLIERRLGQWNGQDIATTQPLLEAGLSPPGGETETAFRSRIRQTLVEILDRPYRCPLLVASKGVARVLGILVGAPSVDPADNAAIIRFDIPPGDLY